MSWCHQPPWWHQCWTLATNIWAFVHKHREFLLMQNWLDWWLPSELQEMRSPDTGEGSASPGTAATQVSAMALLLGEQYLQSTQHWQTKVQNFLRKTSYSLIATLHTGGEKRKEWAHHCNLSPCAMGVLGREGILYSFKLHIGNFSAPNKNRILIWVKLLFKAKSLKKEICWSTD